MGVATGLEEHFQALRDREFSRLDEGGHVYLDYTGSGLYAESLLRAHEEYLEHHVLGNPHSENPTSLVATQMVQQARRDVLDFFGADPEVHTAIFTANASAALKLVGESFPFEEGSRFTLMQDNHNSAHGIRAFAERVGSEVVYLPLGPDLRVDEATELPPAGTGPSLFAFPAQSNFSGVYHSLDWVRRARERGYRVLLDAAAYAPTSPLDLTAVEADFVAVAFYKMFGFPTGIGALIARHDALAELRRPWFAGGTVEYVAVEGRTHRLRIGAEAFEDGTPNFLGISAVSAGLHFLSSVGMERLHERVADLTERMLKDIGTLRHRNGSPVIDVYGPSGGEMRGGTVAFNVMRDTGEVVPYGAVERAAGASGISLRGGCFCNPGAAEAALGVGTPEAVACYQAQPQGAFSLKILAECLEYEVPVGALRVSVGVATNERDLERLRRLLEGFRE